MPMRILRILWKILRVYPPAPLKSNPELTGEFDVRPGLRPLEYMCNGWPSSQQKLVYREKTSVVSALTSVFRPHTDQGSAEGEWTDEFSSLDGIGVPLL
jgi:hypothetical protein